MSNVRDHNRFLVNDVERLLLSIVTRFSGRVCVYLLSNSIELVSDSRFFLGIDWGRVVRETDRNQGQSTSKDCLPILVIKLKIKQTK